MKNLGKILSWKVTILMMLLVLIGGFSIYCGRYFPGTLRKREDGSYFGTGIATYRYTNGTVALDDSYRAGKLTQSKWYKPDGSIVAQTSWTSGTNVGYYLRQDGTIRLKMPYLDGRAHGMAICYKEDGVTVDHVEEYRKGVKVPGTAVEP